MVCLCVCTLVPGSVGRTKSSRIIREASTKVVYGLAYVIMPNTHGNHVAITKRLIQCVSPIPKGKPGLAYGVKPDAGSGTCAKNMAGTDVSVNRRKNCTV